MPFRAFFDRPGSGCKADWEVFGSGCKADWEVFRDAAKESLGTRVLKSLRDGFAYLGL